MADANDSLHPVPGLISCFGPCGSTVTRNESRLGRRIKHGFKWLHAPRMAGTFIAPGWTGVPLAINRHGAIWPWTNPTEAAEEGVRMWPHYHTAGQVVGRRTAKDTVTYFTPNADTVSIPPGAHWDAGGAAPSNTYVVTGFWRDNPGTVEVGAIVERCIPSADEAQDRWDIEIYVCIAEVTNPGDPFTDTTHFRNYFAQTSSIEQYHIPARGMAQAYAQGFGGVLLPPTYSRGRDPVSGLGGVLDVCAVVGGGHDGSLFRLKPFLTDGFDYQVNPGDSAKWDSYSGPLAATVYFCALRSCFTVGYINRDDVVSGGGGRVFRAHQDWDPTQDARMAPDVWQELEMWRPCFDRAPMVGHCGNFPSSNLEDEPRYLTFNAVTDVVGRGSAGDGFAVAEDTGAVSGGFGQALSWGEPPEPPEPEVINGVPCTWFAVRLWGGNYPYHPLYRDQAQQFYRDASEGLHEARPRIHSARLASYSLTEDGAEFEWDVVAAKWSFVALADADGRLRSRQDVLGEFTLRQLVGVGSENTLAMVWGRMVMGPWGAAPAGVSAGVFLQPMGGLQTNPMIERTDVRWPFNGPTYCLRVHHCDTVTCETREVTGGDACSGTSAGVELVMTLGDLYRRYTGQDNCQCAP
jgi:hypothetical protein